jgi:hypothetical protein
MMTPSLHLLIKRVVFEPQFGFVSVVLEYKKKTGSKSARATPATVLRPKIFSIAVHCTAVRNLFRRSKGIET